jgi:TonB family protein
MTKPFRFILLIVLFVGFSSFPAAAEQIEENFQPFVLYKPDPQMPMIGLRQNWHGTVICELTINKSTGLVDEVKVTRHTLYPRLDKDVVLTLFKWKFKPNTIGRTRISYQFGVIGTGHNVH